MAPPPRGPGRREGFPCRGALRPPRCAGGAGAWARGLASKSPGKMLGGSRRPPSPPLLQQAPAPGPAALSSRTPGSGMRGLEVPPPQLHARGTAAPGCASLLPPCPGWAPGCRPPPPSSAAWTRGRARSKAGHGEAQIFIQAAGPLPAACPGATSATSRLPRAAAAAAPPEQRQLRSRVSVPGRARVGSLASNQLPGPGDEVGLPATDVQTQFLVCTFPRHKNCVWTIRSGDSRGPGSQAEPGWFLEDKRGRPRPGQPQPRTPELSG